MQAGEEKDPSMAGKQNDESTVPASTDQQQEPEPSPAKPTFGIYHFWGLCALGFLAGSLLQSTFESIYDSDRFSIFIYVLPLAGLWLAASCALAIRISISHGVVPGVVFGLVVFCFPVLISAGGWLTASIWHPGPNSYLLFVSTGIGALIGGGLGAWLIYKTAKWLDAIATAKKKAATDEPPAGDEESDSDAL